MRGGVAAFLGYTPTVNSANLLQNVQINFNLYGGIPGGSFNNPSTVTIDQLRSDVSASLRLTRDPNAAVDFTNGVSVRTGVNILGIGLSNYDTNRLPVPNGNNAPTATPCTGCFPLAAFDNVRATALSQSQANPDQVFGAQARSYLGRFGLGQAALAFDRLVYQVNSADQIQAVFVRFSQGPTVSPFETATTYPDPGYFALLFKGGVIPTIATTDPSLLPEFALVFQYGSTFSAHRHSVVADNPNARQLALAGFYGAAANAGRRNNYITNLNHLRCNLLDMQQRLTPPRHRAD